MAEVGRVSLGDLLAPETVRARVPATSWQEASAIAGQLLVETGRAEARYIPAMQSALQELGPYAVIAPGIALLHARPDDGVLAPCLALVTLARPVEFGSRENDPVDLVFALGAVDKTAHLAALQELANLLMDQQLLVRLRAAADDQALLFAIRDALDSKRRES
jgi:mannitol/fructose-specific phosphotransferase system IIA component (Ntr-type)